MEIIEIEEEKDKFWGLYYSIKYTNMTDKVFIRVVKEKKDNNYIFFLFGLDFEMGLKVYKFLNDQDYNYSVKEQNANALKQLFCYLKIFNLKIDEMDYKNAVRFDKFLQGGRLIGESTKQIIYTQRKNSTTKIYLDVCRDFVRSLKLLNHILLKKSSVGGGEKDNEKYLIEPKVNRRVESPAYITLEKYKELISKARSRDSILDKEYVIMLRLMYEYGLRIGEVLGITIEDFVFDNENGNYYLFLRNRVTDKRGQICKGLVVPKHSDEYGRGAYNNEGEGYWIIVLTYEFSLEISEYLDLVNSKLSKMKNRAALMAEIRADKVSRNNNIRINYYVFFNKRNKRLLQGSWNSVLRNLFKEVGISIDNGKRKNNLNHKLRHSFAMIRRKKYGYSREEIRILLRQKSAASSEPYLLPNQEELVNENINISREIEEYIYGR